MTDFFERYHCIVQPVFGDNDIGKDAYVDLTDERRVTGLVIALQIKGGAQVARGEDRGIPFTRNDAELYRCSTIPVIGIAHDAGTGALWWVNLTAHCRARHDEGIISGGFALARNRLTRSSLSEFKVAMRQAATPDITGNVLDLVSDDPREQAAAVNDCFALGRRDARAMLLLRRNIVSLHPGAIMAGLYALAHLTPHPDLGWTSWNWISGPVKDRLRSELRWSARELSLFLSVVDDDADMWGGGVVGENVTMLLLQDPDLSAKLVDIVRDHNQGMHIRFRALVYLIYLTKDDGQAHATLQDELNASPELTSDRSVRELAMHVEEQGWLDVF